MISKKVFMHEVSELRVEIAQIKSTLARIQAEAIFLVVGDTFALIMSDHIQKGGRELLL